VPYATPGADITPIIDVPPTLAAPDRPLALPEPPPLLLIHGAADANSGTYPIQSQRLFDAIRGNGGRARLVVLPHESNAYLARELVLHVLAEQFSWLERWLGAAPAGPAGPPEPVSLSGRSN
jgi:hypothetical protein